MLTAARLRLTRTQILAFRRAVQALDERLPHDTSSLRHASWAGLQDSMPRAALLSLHARVEDTVSTTWEAPSLVQLWGPRYSAFVVDARDAPVFTVGRLPDTGSTRRGFTSMGHGRRHGARMLLGSPARFRPEICVQEKKTHDPCSGVKKEANR